MFRTTQKSFPIKPSIRAFVVKNKANNFEFYGNNIFYTHNVADPLAFNSNPAVAKRPWGAETEKDPLAPGQQRMLSVPILVETKKITNEDSSRAVSTIFASTLDMDHIFNRLDLQESQDVDLYIYNFNSCDLTGRNTCWKNYPERIQREIVTSLVKAKYFAGEINLLDPSLETASLYFKEKQFFIEWLNQVRGKKGKEEVKRMEINLKKYLVALRPSIDLQKDYPSSTMAKAFREVLCQT